MPKGNFSLLLYPFFNEKNNQYINPIIDAKNIDSNILIGPSHNPKIIELETEINNNVVDFFIVTEAKR